MEIIGPKRSELANSIDQALRTELSKAGFSVDMVNLGASHLPQSVEQALQTKMQAQQRAQQAQYDLARATTEAQQKIVEAKAEAQATIARAQGEAEANRIRSLSITPAILKQKWLEKWNGDVPKVAGSSANLLLNYSDLEK